MSLLLNSLGFLGPFTHSLPLFILIGPLAINPAISVSRLVSLFPYYFPFLTFFIFLGFFYCLALCRKWASIVWPVYLYIFNRFHHTKEDDVEIIYFCAKILSTIGRGKSKIIMNIHN